MYRLTMRARSRLRGVTAVAVAPCTA